MSEATEEVLKFVLLLEEHIDVISKSQTSVNKKKKDEAVALIIPKWQNISKTKLTRACLYKKINNLKTRAKSAYKCGKTLNEWQAKLLKLIQNDIDEDGDNFQSDQFDVNVDNDSELVPKTPKTTAEQVLSELETDQTKLLNNEQLQRFVLLQQLQVVTLQRKRLENLNNIENGKSISFDYIGFEDQIEDATEPTQT